MLGSTNPYLIARERAFGHTSVGSHHFTYFDDIWHPMPLKKSDRIATAGSCVAQHIGNRLTERGALFMDLEPAPPSFKSSTEARTWGYGVFSCRYGNIYTTPQLLQLFDEAHGNRIPLNRVWEKDGRFYDLLRTTVDSVGHDSPETVLVLRQSHLNAVRQMFSELDVFVFTMGMTEGWEHLADRTMYGIAPEVAAEADEPDSYVLRTLRHAEVLSDIVTFRERLKAVNPTARILLTVSPVPLTVTAIENHVLPATIYSKPVLRAVVGEISDDFDDTFYFPSFELIASHPARGFFYEAELRNVNSFGVNYVIGQFFSGPIAEEFSVFTSLGESDLNLICVQGGLDTSEKHEENANAFGGDITCVCCNIINGIMSCE